MTENLMGDTTLAIERYRIDLEALYRAMHAQSVLEADVRVFHGNSKEMYAQ